MPVVSLTVSYDNYIKDTLIDLGDYVLRNNQGSVCYIKNLKNNFNYINKQCAVYINNIEDLEKCIEIVGTEFILVSDNKYVFKNIIENNYNLRSYFLFKKDEDISTIYHDLLKTNNIKTELHIILDMRYITLHGANKLLALKYNGLVDFKIYVISSDLENVPNDINNIVLVNNKHLMYNASNTVYIKNESFPAYQILIGQHSKNVLHYIDVDNSKIELIKNNIFIVNFIHYLGGLINNEKDINL